MGNRNRLVESRFGHLVSRCRSIGSKCESVRPKYSMWSPEAVVRGPDSGIGSSCRWRVWSLDTVMQTRLDCTKFQRIWQMMRKEREGHPGGAIGEKKASGPETSWQVEAASFTAL